MNNSTPQRALRISQVCELTGLGRTSVYAAIKQKRLIARKHGRRTLVLAEDLDTFLRSLAVMPSRKKRAACFPQQRES